MSSIETILRNSMAVYDGMPTTAEPLNISEDVTYGCDGCYCMNNGIYAFVYKHNVYVAPYTKALSTLLEESFDERTFGVPFSVGVSLPVGKKASEWIFLKRRADEIRAREKEEKCRKWAEDHNIKEIDTSNMLRIPERGIEVVNRFGETHREYPVDTALECIERVGLYGLNNGLLAIVGVDGRTYVTKGYGLVDELKSKGYKEENIGVPFSWGETIVDPIIAAEWDHVVKK